MLYKSILIDGVKIFYREAGKPSNPTILLLHGFPSSSHMYRDLMHNLSDQYHLIAPDYPALVTAICPIGTAIPIPLIHCPIR